MFMFKSTHEDITDSYKVFIKKLESENESLSISLANTEDKLKSTSEKLDEAEQRIVGLNQNLSDMETEVTKKEEIISKLKKDNIELQEKYNISTDNEKKFIEEIKEIKTNTRSSIDNLIYVSESLLEIIKNFTVHAILNSPNNFYDRLGGLKEVTKRIVKESEVTLNELFDDILLVKEKEDEQDELNEDEIIESLKE